MERLTAHEGQSALTGLGGCFRTGGQADLSDGVDEGALTRGRCGKLRELFGKSEQVADGASASVQEAFFLSFF